MEQCIIMKKSKINNILKRKYSHEITLMAQLFRSAQCPQAFRQVFLSAYMTAHMCLFSPEGLLYAAVV